MKNILKISFFVLSILLTSCSSDDDNSSGISNDNISGEIEGESFTAVGGKAFDTTLGNEQHVSINITNVQANCDSYVTDYDLYISTTVLLKVGTYDDANVVFLKDGENPLNVFQSTVIVEEITDTAITVKIKSKADYSESKVEGKFTVVYCQ